MSSNQRDRERRNERAKDLLVRLRERYPAVFQNPPLPLAIDIAEQIAEAMDCRNRMVVATALRIWDHSPQYRAAVSAGGPRYNLDGSPSGGVSRRARTHQENRLHELEDRWQATGRAHLIPDAQHIAFLARERKRQRKAAG